MRLTNALVNGIVSILNDTSKIEVFEMWCLRQMGNIKWKDHISNETVLKKLKTSRQLLKNIFKIQGFFKVSRYTTHPDLGWGYKITKW